MSEEEKLKIELEASNITIGLQVDAYKKIQQENKQLKEVIEEVREYINNNWDGSYTDATLKNKVAELNITELLQILDKVKED